MKNEAKPTLEKTLTTSDDMSNVGNDTVDVHGECDNHIDTTLPVSATANISQEEKQVTFQTYIPTVERKMDQRQMIF